jgi:RimJ/RimL family protein N-acetyltransferase
MNPPEMLETERLALKRPGLADVQPLFTAYTQDAEVTRYLSWPPHQSIRETERFVAECIVAWDEGERFAWTIRLKGQGLLIGMIEIRMQGPKAEVGYVLARAFWGQGLMTEALRRVLEWTRTQPEIYRVWAVCDVDNTASARVLKKAGMEYEGILHRWTVLPNISAEPRDCHCYAWCR